MSPLQSILATYRATSQSEREKGTYFEELIRTYFRFEATYAKIMACGTGKTFTSLKIAEEVAGKDKRVLFLVPSLNLLSQTLTEWTQESAIPRLPQNEAFHANAEGLRWCFEQLIA